MGEPVTIEETCIGCGACVGHCDGCFKMEGEKSIFIDKDRKHGVGCYKDAADICPVNAIIVHEEELKDTVV